MAARLTRKAIASNTSPGLAFARSGPIASILGDTPPRPALSADVQERYRPLPQPAAALGMPAGWAVGCADQARADLRVVLELQ